MILVGGVGYHDLRDLSFGPRLIERMGRETWPADVEVQDLSYGPMAVVQWLQDEPGRFDRLVLAGAVERGRTPGALVSYAWTQSAVPPDEVQGRVAEAVTGVLGLDNLLVIAQWFGVLPADTWVVELEPVELEWGTEPSAIGAARVEEALTWVRQHVGTDRGAGRNGHGLSIVGAGGA
ncbi:MAG: hypothetical protein H0V87_03755 [Chloroflexi bacterium]|nr:hypothetical protein [Chloroflexota bacterium]